MLHLSRHVIRDVADFASRRLGRIDQVVDLRDVFLALEHFAQSFDAHLRLCFVASDVEWLRQLPCRVLVGQFC